MTIKKKKKEKKKPVTFHISEETNLDFVELKEFEGRTVDGMLRRLIKIYKEKKTD